MTYTLYDRLPHLLSGVNELAKRTGIRRRVFVCPGCGVETDRHMIARRIDSMPDRTFA